MVEVCGAYLYRVCLIWCSALVYVLSWCDVFEHLKVSCWFELMEGVRLCFVLVFDVRYLYYYILYYTLLFFCSVLLPFHILLSSSSDLSNHSIKGLHIYL